LEVKLAAFAEADCVTSAHNLIQLGKFSKATLQFAFWETDFYTLPSFSPRPIKNH
jgi:hypothetical protein